MTTGEPSLISWSILGGRCHDATAMLARFRLAAARRLEDPAFVELIDKLHEHATR